MWSWVHVEFCEYVICMTLEKTIIILFVHWLWEKIKVNLTKVCFQHLLWFHPSQNQKYNGVATEMLFSSFMLFVPLYPCIFFVWFLFRISYRDLIYDMKKKKHMCKKLARKNFTKKTLWTFEWSKMSHVFISPHHNHFFAWISIFIFSTCTLRKH